MKVELSKLELLFEQLGDAELTPELAALKAEFLAAKAESERIQLLSELEVDLREQAEQLARQLDQRLNALDIDVTASASIMLTRNGTEFIVDDVQLEREEIPVQCKQLIQHLDSEDAEDTNSDVLDVLQDVWGDEFVEAVRLDIELDRFVSTLPATGHAYQWLSPGDSENLYPGEGAVVLKFAPPVGWKVDRADFGKAKSAKSGSRTRSTFANWAPAGTRATNLRDYVIEQFGPESSRPDKKLCAVLAKHGTAYEKINFSQHLLRIEAGLPQEDRHYTDYKAKSTT